MRPLEDRLFARRFRGRTGTLAPVPTPSPPWSVSRRGPQCGMPALSDSVELVRNSRLVASALIEVGNDHRLSDPEPLQAMLRAPETNEGAA